jgi:hypothetical protein
LGGFRLSTLDLRRHSVLVMHFRHDLSRRKDARLCIDVPEREVFMTRLAGFVATAAMLASPAFADRRDIDAKHVLIYREQGRFGGWPANHGLWNWGDEILVGFTEATFKPRDNGHATDLTQPFFDRQARSLDGGLTWTVESRRSRTPTQSGSPAQRLSTPLNFTHPDFALMFRFGDNSVGPSWFYYSTSRGKQWKGPFLFPSLGQKGIAARTDYITVDSNSCIAFATAPKSNGREGRPLCSRTDDGGISWTFISFISPEPEGYAIMPSTVRLSPTILLTAIRRKEGGAGWIETHISDDNGVTWRFRNRVVESTGVGSNPASLIRLRDGRLCLTYGYRGKPYGIRARISSDGGRSWSKDLHLRSDGSSTDLGYTRSVQRSDGKIVTVYYFNGPAGRERTIEATIWEPGEH